MEMRVKKIELIIVAVALLMLWLVFVVWRMGSVESIAIAVLLLLIIGVLVILPRKMVMGKTAVEDERLKKMYVYAAQYSWDVTFLLVGILALVVYAGVLEMDAKQIVALLFYGMGLTRAGFYAFLSRRGDVS